MKTMNLINENDVIFFLNIKLLICPKKKNKEIREDREIKLNSFKDKKKEGLTFSKKSIPNYYKKIILKKNQRKNYALIFSIN